MDANKERHKTLEDFIEVLNGHPPLVTAIQADLLYKIPKRRNNARHKAVMYLSIGGYFTGDGNASIHLEKELGRKVTAIMLTPKGVDAYYSDFFYEKYKEKNSEITFKFWTIFLAAIVSFGVIYDIVTNNRDRLKEVGLPTIKIVTNFEDSVKNPNSQFRSEKNVVANVSSATSPILLVSDTAK